MVKRFIEWIALKEKLDNLLTGPPLVKERELWWASVGENVGSEINGKSRLFSRPILVFKKLTRGLFLAIPTTTQPREGSWYVKVTQADKEMFVCLHQLRIIDYRRLSSRLGQLDGDDFNRVKVAFWKLYQ